MRKKHQKSAPGPDEAEKLTPTENLAENQEPGNLPSEPSIAEIAAEVKRLQQENGRLSRELQDALKRIATLQEQNTRLTSKGADTSTLIGTDWKVRDDDISTTPAVEPAEEPEPEISAYVDDKVEVEEEDVISDYTSPYGTVAESIKAEDYLRFGVDPAKGKKKKKEKGPSVLKMLNPRNLQTSVEKYGFQFSAKRFYLYVLLGLAAAVGTGVLFQLDWYFIAIIGAVALLSIPSIFLASIKGMYTAKQFHDVSDYMEQLLYSFRRKRKILTSLEDVYVAFEDDTGPMKELIGKAIEHIRSAETTGDIHREAFDIIEKEYSNDRLRNAHNFMIAVENNGGKVENSIDLLLDERAMWDERVHLFQKEKNTIKRNITFSIVFSLVLCFAILFIFSVDTLADLQIPKNMLVQCTSTVAILLNLVLFVKITNKFTQSWLLREKKQSDYQILRDYFYVKNFDPAKERKLTLITAACTSLIWIVGLLINKPLIIIAGVAITLFCLLSSRLSYSLTKKNVTKEIQKAFPQWIMELALILQTDNVQVSIAKTLDSAPVVLRPELEQLVENFDVAPHSLKPYTEFLADYDLSDIKSAMKMLYSVSTSGTANIEEQIADLIKRQNILMDKAEKIQNSDQLAGMTTINMVPMLFCILKSVADMTVLVFSLFSLMSI